MKTKLAHLLTLTTALLGGCIFEASDDTGTQTTVSLRSFANDEELAAYLKQALTRDASQFASPPYANTVADASTASARQAFSTTNLQEGGVDEADRMKNDGSHMFFLGSDATTGTAQLNIRAFGRRDGVPLTDPTASLVLPEVNFNRMYLTGEPADRVVALGDAGTGGWMLPMARIAARDWFTPWHWRAGRIEVQWVNVTDRAAPSLGHRLGIDGFQVSSRRIGKHLYLVSRYAPSVEGLDTYPLDDVQVARNQRIIEVTPLQELLPKWRLDGVEQGPLVSSRDCYKASSTSTRPETADLIVVTAIDLDNPAATPRSQCLLGGSEAVYMSTQALYVATSRQAYTLKNGLPVYDSESVTDIHKFALVDGLPAYRGSGSVSGHLGWEQDKKSFRMGEHAGVLRIATSLGQSWDNTASTRLTLLRENDGALAIVSQLPNSRHPEPLGKPGEQLYAARFLGTRGYLVTFRLTDPLYVLDLADAENPRIAGELSIPGYSDYLHPIGERWLVGVGKDAIADDSGGDGRGAWYQGVKVALFDVSDHAAPREVNSLVIGRRGSESAATFDHHAITFLASSQETGELGRLALPIQRHETTPAHAYFEAGDPRIWYDWSNTGLHLFSVMDSGLAARGEVLAETAQQSASPTLGVYEDRAVLLGDEVHYLHGDRAWSANW